jgi:hypothetical protein
MEVDSPKSQNLSKKMAHIQGKHDELAQKNPKKLDKCWSQGRKSTLLFDKITVSEMILMGLSYMFQSLVIHLDSIRNPKASMDTSLRIMEAS